MKVIWCSMACSMIRSNRSGRPGEYFVSNPCVERARPIQLIHVENAARLAAAEVLREAFIQRLEPDVVHITSLFEGYVGDAVTSVGQYDQHTPVSITLYDLIPLLIEMMRE